MINQDNKRIAKNTFFLYIRMFILFAVNFYTTRVLLNALGTDDYGLYNVIAGFVAMLGFMNQSMTNSIQRFINFHMGKGDEEGLLKYFKASLTAQLLLGIFILLLFETLGLWFLNAKMNIDPEKVFDANVVFQMSCLCLLVNIIKAPYNAIIIAKERMNFYAYISVAEAAVKLFITFSISWIVTFRLSYYAIMLFALTVIVYILTLMYAKRQICNLSFQLYFHKAIFKEVLSFSGWNLFGAASGAIKSQGINVLMNLFFNTAINAARGIAFQVLSGIQQFVSNFQVAINPQIVQSYASGDKDRYLKLTYLSAKLSLYLMWVIALPVMANLDLILDIWLGKEMVPKYTSLFVYIILFTGLFDALGSSISVPLYATGNIKRYQIVTSSIKFTVLPISYILYRMGFEPAASMYISLFLAGIEQTSRVFIWGRLVKESPLIYLNKVVFPASVIICLSSLIMYLIVEYVTKFNTFLSFGINTMIAVSLAILMIYFIGLNRIERNQILNIIRKKYIVKHNK